MIFEPIRSNRPNGALDEAVATFNADTDSNWVVLNNPGSSELSEGHLDFEPFSAISPTNKIELGASWRKFYEDFSDISFQYSIEGVDGPITGIVEFTGNGGESFDRLDLDFDSDIDFDDYQAFLDAYGSVPTLEGKLLAERHSFRRS